MKFRRKNPPTTKQCSQKCNDQKNQESVAEENDKKVKFLRKNKQISSQDAAVRAGCSVSRLQLAGFFGR